MFWLSPEWVEARIKELLDEGKSIKEIALDIAREQVKEFFEWQLELCDIHHSSMVRMDCEKCLKNVRKELGL